MAAYLDISLSTDGRWKSFARERGWSEEETARRRFEYEARCVADVKGQSGLQGDLIDAEFSRWRIWDIDPEKAGMMQEALRRAKDFSTRWRKRFLILSGPTGTGKTMLAAAMCDVIIRDAMARRRPSPVCWSAMMDLHYALDAARRYSVKRKKGEVMKPFHDASVVVLDDMGTVTLHEETRGMIEHLFDDSINRDHAIVMTTNLTADGLLIQLGDRIRSRFKWTGETIATAWDDYREFRGRRDA